MLVVAAISCFFAAVVVSKGIHRFPQYPRSRVAFMFVARRRRVSASRAVLLFVYASLGVQILFFSVPLFGVIVGGAQCEFATMNKTHGAHF